MQIKIGYRTPAEKVICMKQCFIINRKDSILSNKKKKKQNCQKITRFLFIAKFMRSTLNILQIKTKIYFSNTRISFSYLLQSFTRSCPANRRTVFKLPFINTFHSTPSFLLKYDFQFNNFYYSNVISPNWRSVEVYLSLPPFNPHLKQFTAIYCGTCILRTTV